MAHIDGISHGPVHGEDLMKSYRKELWFNVPGRRGSINITPQAEAALRESRTHVGLCLVDAMHTIARVFINDDEPGLN